MELKWSKWAFRAYCKLWKRYNRKTIKFDDIQETLKLDSRSLGVLVSDLKKCGWLISKSIKESRRSEYNLEPLEKVIDDSAKHWDVSLKKKKAKSRAKSK